MAVKGLTPQSALVFQLIREADNAPGTYNADADRYLMPSLRVDLQPETAYDNFRPMGWSARAWNLVTRLHSVLSGAVKLDFAQMSILLELLCGPAVSESFPSGQWTRVYQLVQSGRQPRSVFTSEFGTKAAVSRMPYTLLQALTLNWVRMTDNNEGSVTLLARKPISDNVALTGSVSQNTIFTVSADVVTGNATLSLKDTDGAPVGAVTIPPGMTASDLKAAIEALSFYNTVSVTGSTPALVLTNVALSASGASATASSQEGPADPNFALDADAGNGGWLAAAISSLPQTFTVDLGTPQAIESYEFTYIGDHMPKSWTLHASATGAFAGEEVLIDTQTNRTFAQVSNILYALVSATAPYQHWRFTFTAAQNDDGTAQTQVGFSQLIMNTSTTSTGTYTITVTDPGNTPIAAPTITGPGWTTERTQQGSSANIVLPQLVPISPQMWMARRASSYSGLGAASPISRIAGFTMDFPDRTNLFWFLDENDIDFDDFVDGEGEVSAKLTLVNDVDGPVADLAAKSEQMPGLAEWWRFLANHPDGLYSLGIDGLFGVNGNIPYSNNNNARFREFPMSAMLNDQGWLLQFTLTVAL